MNTDVMIANQGLKSKGSFYNVQNCVSDVRIAKATHDGSQSYFYTVFSRSDKSF